MTATSLQNTISKPELSSNQTHYGSYLELLNGEIKTEGGYRIVINFSALRNLMLNIGESRVSRLLREKLYECRKLSPEELCIKINTFVSEKICHLSNRNSNAILDCCYRYQEKSTRQAAVKDLSKMVNYCLKDQKSSPEIQQLRKICTAVKNLFPLVFDASMTSDHTRITQERDGVRAFDGQPCRDITNVFLKEGIGRNFPCQFYFLFYSDHYATVIGDQAYYKKADPISFPVVVNEVQKRICKFLEKKSQQAQRTTEGGSEYKEEILSFSTEEDSEEDNSSFESGENKNKLQRCISNLMRIPHCSKGNSSPMLISMGNSIGLNLGSWPNDREICRKTIYKITNYEEITSMWEGLNNRCFERLLSKRINGRSLLIMDDLRFQKGRSTLPLIGVASNHEGSESRRVKEVLDRASQLLTISIKNILINKNIFNINSFLEDYGSIIYRDGSAKGDKIYISFN